MPLKSVASPLFALPRGSKQLLAAALDSSVCVLTVWLAFYLRMGFFVSLAGRPSIAVALAIALAIPAFYITGLYRLSFRRTGLEIVPTIAAACVGYGLIYAAMISAYAFDNVPRTIGIIQPILMFLATSMLRLGVGRLLSQNGGRWTEQPKRVVVIYGAGSSGRQLAGAISESREFRVCGFLDDDRSIDNTRVDGLRVYAPDRLAHLIETKGVSDVFLALPSAPRHRRNEIIAGLRGVPVKVQTLPGLMDLAHGRVKASDLRELTIDDLLFRDAVAVESDTVREKIAGKTILITGAGGSIGSELCRQIAVAQPGRLLLLENNEFALYAINRTLADAVDFEVVPLLGSVTDTIRLTRIIEAWKPDMIFHAAAYKHVPLVEHNPLEGLCNNVIGTWRLAEIADKMGVRDFVLISTDKAVRPTNIMGASKRLAELVLQGLGTTQTRTRFSMVRFGNVLGSSGSVVPLFRKQINEGGPITITHRDITRYFMTIPEAAQLVVQASTMAGGGEVFVLDMGEPVRIIDLARNMVELCGLTVRDQDNPNGDIEIVMVGMRPGEKLYEELLIGNDPHQTKHPRIMMATEPHLPWSQLRADLKALEALIEAADVPGARALLGKLVPEYTPNSDIVDWVTMREEVYA